MAVIAHVIVRGVSAEQYDAVRAHAGWLEQAPTGGLGHLTWWEGGDCHNIDAWESEEAFAAFGEHRLGPAMAAAGVTTQPEVTFHPAHEVFLPRQLTIAPTAAPSSGADNVAVLRRGYQAFAEGDIGTVLAMFDQSISWYAPDTVRFGGTYAGPAAVGEFFSKLPENYAELRVEPLAFMDSGDSVTVTGRHRGRSTAGNSFDIPFVHLWTLDGGKVTSFTEHFDTVKMNAALGHDARVPATTA
jgi:ketosteroid isomerase-like protein